VLESGRARPLRCSPRSPRGRAPDAPARAPTVMAMSTTNIERSVADLVRSVDSVALSGDASSKVSALAYRSTDVVPGALFFCVPGTTTDGHRYAAAAVDGGASVLMVERALPLDVTQVVVRSVRVAMGPVSAEFYGRPADRMTMVGVTGTSGKTTTTYLMESVFRAAGTVPGVIGSTGIRVDGRAQPFKLTTPEAPDLHRLLADMVEAGVGAVAMEVSSHGLDQRRVGGIRFAGAVFTNLSQDHLDYHGDMKEYFAAKARLFTPGRADRGTTNIDSEEGRRLLRAPIPMTSYGLGPAARVRGEDVRAGADGLTFRVGPLEIRSALRGRFNVWNCLAALAASRLLDIDDAVAVRGISRVSGVPGRMETVSAGQDFLVLVDYSHKPGSLENVLESARRLTAGRVIVTFGCGGDRDRTKRPLMGEVATRLADFTVITSDNPRSEEPEAIIAAIEPGARRGGGAFVTEPDRRSAIRQALRAAAPGDVVVIAGKGDEPGQELADRTVPFDDRVVAEEELRALAEERR